MRTRTTILIGALLLASASVAQAQGAPTAPTSPNVGQVDFGVRGTDITGDEARYNRFRDRRDGGYLDNFRFQREESDWVLLAEAGNVGYRDQRYFAGFNKLGRLKASFEWDQVPLFTAADARWLYTDEGNGVLRIADALQQGVQGGSLSVANALAAGGRTFDLKSRRDTAALNLVYTANRNVDVSLSLKNVQRNGSSLTSVNFGSSPGNMNAIEIGAPLDDRTTDVKAAVEFANARGLLSVGYLGSWYQNQIDSLVFDNPLRFADISGGPSQGRMPWWPTNTAFSFNVNGSYKLPKKTRASAAISIGRWSQDETLVPATINTALVAPTLERATAETEADIVSMVYGLTSRPVGNVWLSAKYRYYDYDNKTPIFDTVALNSDWAAGTALEETEPASFKRQTFDVDASFTPMAYLGLNVGYGREDADRTFRIFEKTAEDTFRVSVDSTGNQYFTVRTKYEYSTRTGSGFDAHLLEEVGEQPDTRHFDIADRDRNP
jgi:MtrB/PioB family decaheme-associated outer membrane protein